MKEVCERAAEFVSVKDLTLEISTFNVRHFADSTLHAPQRLRGIAMENP